MNSFLCGAVAFVACGCVAPQSESISVRSFDRNIFGTTIQPILAERCANPSCHGQFARPFAIYALNEGLSQMRKHDYTAELRASGVKNVHAMVIAFDGKKVIVAPGGTSEKKKKSGTSRKVGQSSRKGVKKATAKRKR